MEWENRHIEKLTEEKKEKRGGDLRGGAGRGRQRDRGAGAVG